MNGTDLSGTVAILAQGTNWADALAQALFGWVPCTRWRAPRQARAVWRRGLSRPTPYLRGHRALAPSTAGPADMLSAAQGRRPPGNVRAPGGRGGGGRGRLQGVPAVYWLCRQLRTAQVARLRLARCLCARACAWGPGGPVRAPLHAHARNATRAQMRTSSLSQPRGARAGATRNNNTGAWTAPSGG